MSKILVLSALVAFCAAPYVANAHVCKHGDPDMQRAHRAATAAVTTAQKTFSGQAVVGGESIRVGIDYTNLGSESKYCTSASDTRPFMSSGATNNQQCNTNSIYNPATMTSIIADHLMPSARDIIASTYNVTRIASQPIVANQCGEAVDVSGPGATVYDVDLQIFVAAGVMPASYANTIAYAYPCTVDASTNRPISAVINFNPYYLNRWTSDRDSYNNNELIQTALHELHHAMGFTATNLQAMSDTRTVRGKSVIQVTSAKVLEKAREHFGCDTLPGLEIEDEGGSGSVRAHWDRRIAFEDLMVSAGGAKFSSLTLAFMEDLGYYSVNYSQAIGMVVGTNAGCGFIEQKCNTAAGGKDTAWFFDDSYRCSPDHRMITKSSWGVSSTSIPSYFVYDDANPTYASPESGFTDRCPYGIRVSGSECAWEPSDSNGELIASYPSASSRCFETSGLRVTSSSSSVSYNSRCLKARCPFGGERIEFNLGGSWIACPLDGTAQDGVESPSGYSGSIHCPVANTLCDEKISTGSSEKEAMASGDVTLPEGTGFTSLTIVASFNGTQWESILTDTRRVAMVNHLRQDMAFLLKTSSTNLRVRRLTATSTGLTAIFGVAEAAYTSDVVLKVLSRVAGTGSFLSYVHITYSSGDSAASASEGPTIALTSYSVDDPQSESICGGGMSAEKCITIISVVVFGVVCVVLLIVIYCVCLRNPFGTKPQPNTGAKYASGVGDGSRSHTEFYPNNRSDGASPPRRNY